MKASKLQQRVLGLLGKEHDGTYDMCSRLLEEMGLPHNGAPEGYTARQAGKLTDEELLNLLPRPENTDVEVKTTEELREEEMEERKQNYIEMRKRQRYYDRLNSALAYNGYRWRKMTEEDWDAYEGRPWAMPTGWVLFDPQGEPIDVEEAKKKVNFHE